VDHFEYYEFEIAHPSTHPTTLFYNINNNSGIGCNPDIYWVVGVPQDMCYQINIHTDTYL